MRPATAASRKSQSSSRSIWKKYESARPEKNNFYCFKTITEILEGHQRKPLNNDKKEIYYHRVNEPSKFIQQNIIQKQNYQKRSSHQLERNPTLKKVMSNNFFSTKQITKENFDIANILKINTLNQIKAPDPKFLPYREQSISIIKQSKILSQTDNFGKQQVNYDRSNKTYQQPLAKRKNMISRKKDRPSKTQYSTITLKEQEPKQYKDEPKYYKDEAKYYKGEPKRSKDENQFVIEQWDNFEEDNSNFSMLIPNANRIN